MFVRVITLLLAVFVMTAAAVPDGFVSTDSVQAADDVPGDVDTPIVARVAIPSPLRRPTIALPVAPRVSRGRPHVACVFRPPRRVASR